MPTVSEPIDQDIRHGKAQAMLDHYVHGRLGAAACAVSLRILHFEPEEIQHMMYEATKTKVVHRQ